MVRRAHDGGAGYLFALNRGTQPVTVPGRGVDLLSGIRSTGTVTVSGGQAVVLREDG